MDKQMAALFTIKQNIFILIPEDAKRTAIHPRTTQKQVKTCEENEEKIIFFISKQHKNHKHWLMSSKVHVDSITGYIGESLLAVIKEVIDTL